MTFYYKCRLLVNHMVLVLFNVKNPKMPSRLSKKVNNFAAETKGKAFCIPLPSPIGGYRKPYGKPN